MKEQTNFFEVNKSTWNQKVSVHAQSEMYNMEKFKLGETSLMPYELKALSNTIKGKSLLHLQCHFGQDTLSWSRMGANCVGVDISDEGIKLAEKLNNELNLNAEFVCCNVLDTSKHVSKTFDIIYTSYGVIGWLPDLKPWANMIYEKLNNGGIFYMVEFHPILWMFDYSKGEAEMKYPYRQDEVIYEEYQGTYADENSKMVSKEYGWNHGLSDVVNALINAGLEIKCLNEYDESPYNVFPNMLKTESGMYKLNNQLHPTVFEISALKR